MSKGVINSTSGAHEYHTDVASGLVDKDKSTYTQQILDKQMHKKRQLRKKIHVEEHGTYNENYTKGQNQSAEAVQSNSNNTRTLKADTSQGYTNNDDTADVSQRYEKNLLYSDEQGSLKYSTAIHKNIGENRNLRPNKSHNGNKFKKVVKQSADSTQCNSNNVRFTETEPGENFSKQSANVASTVVKGTSFLANSQSYQNDTGEDTAKTIEKTAKSVIEKSDTFTAKSDKSRYFKVAGKASDSINISEQTGRFVKSTNSAKQIGKKGIRAIDTVLINPLVKASGDDVGSQAVVKSIEIAKYTATGAKITARTAKATGKTIYKTGKSTAKYAHKAAKAATQVTVKVAQFAATTATKIIAFISSNPFTAIIALILIIVILIISLCSSVLGVTQITSYSGTGNNTTMDANDYSAVYDYINKAIAQRCLDLFNLQDTWTGFLEYNYQYKIENDDGTFTDSVYYPIADVAPIMACLSINHQTYTLDNQIKTEIDDIINYLYTFDYLIEPCTKIVYHDNDHYTTYTGEKVTYTITYHNADSFLENNGYIPSEKKSTYYAIKSYGDMTYFRMYNILKDKNWHDWIVEQYGYSVSSRYNHSTGLYEHELVNHDYCKLGRKNNNPVPDIYSPLNGTVTKLTETSEYDYELTIKDNQNNLEFTIMAEFQQHFHPQVNVGDNVVAGQLIAKNNYDVYIKCKAQADSTLYVNPMLIMEYYQHAN